MSKKAKIILFSVAGVLVAAVFALVIIEGSMSRKYTIYNNTDKNITSLKVVFENAENADEYMTIFEGSLKAGEKIKGSFDKISFLDESLEDAYFQYDNIESLLKEGISESERVPGDIGVLVTFEGEEESYDYSEPIFGTFEKRFVLEFIKDEDGEFGGTLTIGNGLFSGSNEINELSFDPDDELSLDDFDEDWELDDEDWELSDDEDDFEEE